MSDFFFVLVITSSGIFLAEFIAVNSIPEICVTDLAINIYTAAQFYEVWL